MTRIIIAAATLFALTGCGSSKHMQYDFGRAFTAANTAQADLTRPSAANSAFPLSGVEAAAIRINVTASTTEEKDSQSTLKQGN